MIPPRGCAYIVMIHRQDAFRALQKLSRGSYKVNQKAIKVCELHRLLQLKDTVFFFSRQVPSPHWYFLLSDCLGFKQGHKAGVQIVLGR